MILATDVAVMARIMLDSGANAEEAVFALVAEADKASEAYESRKSSDLLVCARAITRAHQERADEGPSYTWHDDLDDLDVAIEAPAA